MHKTTHSKGKHSEKKSFNNETNFFRTNTKKIILSIILVIICLFALYFAYTLYFSNTSIDTTAEKTEEYFDSSETVPVSNTITINGADYLQITGLHINSSNPEASTISATVTNTSDSSYEDINLRIDLLDEQSNIITSLDCKIDKIEAHGDSLTFATLKRDLSNCVNYSISLKK